jgi:hypothetical protein
MTKERNLNMSEMYTKEMHEEYRREVDEQAAKEEEARNERAEKVNSPKLGRGFILPLLLFGSMSMLAG